MANDRNFVSVDVLAAKEEPNISQGFERSSAKNEGGPLQTFDRENELNDDFMCRSTAL